MNDSYNNRRVSHSCACMRTSVSNSQMPVKAVNMRAYEAVTMAKRLERFANVEVKGVINFINT